jgi:hypothetical protein
MKNKNVEQHLKDILNIAANIKLTKEQEIISEISSNINIYGTIPDSLLVALLMERHREADK